MELFKEGKVQRDAKLWYFFNDFFMKLSRKDSVGFVETGKF
jgi:hypothetical protein